MKVKHGMAVLAVCLGAAFPSAALAPDNGLMMTRSNKSKFVSNILFLMLVFSNQTAAETLAGRASVIDGDTVEILGDRVRLHGIDAPESRQRCRRPSGEPWRCGKEATWALDKRVNDRPVRCEGQTLDRYGRLIGVCYVGNLDLNGWMVEQGRAVAYRRYSRDYVAAERRARERSAGIWAGDFVMPWDWRRGKRLTGDTPPRESKDRDCSDFRTQIEAQHFFEAHQPGDPHRLDGNNDGVACESSVVLREKPRPSGRGGIAPAVRRPLSLPPGWVVSWVE